MSPPRRIDSRTHCFISERSTTELHHQYMSVINVLAFPCSIIIIITISLTGPYPDQNPGGGGQYFFIHIFVTIFCNK